MSGKESAAGSDTRDDTDGGWIFYVNSGLDGWRSECRGKAAQEERVACVNAQRLHLGKSIQGKVCSRCARNLQLAERGRLPPGNAFLGNAY